MKILGTWLLASALVTFNFTGNEDNINHRPYISTNLAKVIMTEDEDTVEEKCDGSGWITHGDGHKTECPGCSACEDKVKPEPDPKPNSGCDCGCGKQECNCQESGQCFPLKEDVKKKRIIPRLFDVFRRSRILHLSFWSEVVWPMREDETADLGKQKGQRSDRAEEGKTYYL